MRVIFLDVDGVLNNYAHYLFNSIEINTYKIGSPEFMPLAIDPWNVRNLKYILEWTDANIVISSTWRAYYKLEEFNKYLATHDITNKVISKTVLRLSSDFSTRSNEIDLWVKENKIKKEDYIVLDDHAIYSEYHPDFDRFYRTDCDNGLTYTDACNVIQKLDPKWQKPIFFF